MAFTTKSNITLHAVSDVDLKAHSFFPYFHPKDIDIVMSQTVGENPGVGVIGVQMVPATVHSGSKNKDVECLVLVGITNMKFDPKSGNVIEITRAEDPNNFMALPCPPWDDPIGGKFLTKG